MIYNFIYTEGLKKDLKKLDLPIKRQIINYIENNIINTNNPYNSQYKTLKGQLKGLARYRIGDYRLVVKIENEKFIILGLEVAHRKEIYK